MHSASRLPVASLAAAVVALSGCGAGIVDTTRIESLRTVAVVAEPTEVAPFEATTLTATIADPAGQGAEVATWLCTPLGVDQCLESALTGLAQPVSVSTRDADTHSAQATVVPVPIEVDEITALIEDETTVFRGVLAWTLACRPGLCPLFDQVDQDTVDPVDLANPSRMLETLPIDGVSLTVRTLPVSLRPDEAREQNPVISATEPLPLTLSSGDTRPLDVSIRTDRPDTRVYPSATVGGFTSADVGTTDPIRWSATRADAGTTGHVYIVAVTPDGGQSVWWAQARVE